MRKLLLVLLALLPFAATSAVQQFRVTWDPLPGDQNVSVELSINGGPYQPVGQAPGNASLDFSADVNPGDTLNVRAWASKEGFPDSDRSEVATRIIPLAPPTGVQVVPRP